MNSCQSVSCKQLTQVAILGLNKPIKSLDVAAPEARRHFGDHRKRLAQFALNKRFCGGADLDHFRNGDTEIARLFNQSLRLSTSRFWRVYQIQPNEILDSISADMKTVAIVRSVFDELTIFERNPVFLN